MITENRYLEVFNQNREAFYNYANKRLISQMFTATDVGILLDEILRKTVTCGRSKKFDSVEDVIQYTFHSIRSNARVLYFKRRSEMMNQITLTDDERIKNFELAVSIIDANRPE